MNESMHLLKMAVVPICHLSFQEGCKKHEPESTTGSFKSSVLAARKCHDFGYILREETNIGRMESSLFLTVGNTSTWYTKQPKFNVCLVKQPFLM